VDTMKNSCEVVRVIQGRKDYRDPG
jgi:hypothetical protein